MKRRHSDGNREFNPETLALGYGYDPQLSQQAVKPPIFLTSTFQFSSAAEGKRFFELAYGLREPEAGEKRGLIYSRLNNPNLQMFEERMAAWDRTEMGATFATGMAAISTSMLALLKPGDAVISTSPVYGGTHYLFQHILPGRGIEGWSVPIHQCCLVAMGVHLLDNLCLGRLSEACAQRSRWEFFLTVAPLRVEGGTGGPVNPVAVL